MKLLNKEWWKKNLAASNFDDMDIGMSERILRLVASGTSFELWDQKERIWSRVRTQSKEQI